MNERSAIGITATPDLAAVIRAWPDLPQVIRVGILAMVKAAAPDAKVV